MRPRWLVASVAAHVALVLVLLRMYSGFIFGHPEVPSVIAIALPPRGGDARPHREPPPPAAPQGQQIVMPSAEAPVPTAPITPGVASPDSGVVGGVPGAHGLAMGPIRGDARLWVRPMYIPEGGGRPIDMDSVVRERMLLMADIADSVLRNDSLSPLNNPYATPRWTFQRNGKTYGLDARGIHFGSFTIPTAVLALLPFPQGNIDQARANARLMDMRADILRAAARSEAEDDFRRAVAQIRERKDRERREQRAKQDADRQRTRDNDGPIP
jgi:hypothetical protein